MSNIKKMVDFGKFFVVLTILIISLTKCNDSLLKASVSDLNLLFPICKHDNISKCSDIHYKVKGHNGCFDWKLESETWLKMTKKETSTGCFNSIVITSKINTDFKNYVFLNSIDKNTNTKFKIRIGFSYINALTVNKRFTNTIVGEDLEIWTSAFDSNGNQFSSLEGLSFNWSVKNSEKMKKLTNNSNTIAEIIKLSQENKDISTVRREIEINKLSDICFLSGLDTGIVEVTSSLSENGYQNITSKPTEVIIKEDFEIVPKEIWMDVKTRTKIDMLLIQEEKSSNINDKSLNSFNQTKSKVKVKSQNFIHYNHTLTDNLCGKFELKDDALFTSNSKICETKLEIIDNRLPQYNTDFIIIHVVDPNNIDSGYIKIEKDDLPNLTQEKIVESDLLNHSKYTFSKKWRFQSESYYLVKNFLKYDEKFIVFDEENTEFKVDISDINFNEKNENQIYLKVIKTFYKNNLTLYYAVRELNEYKNKIVTKDNKKTVKSLTIYDPVKIENFNMDRFYLPLFIKNHQELRLIIKGGSGLYHVESENENVIKIENNILYAVGLGTTTVFAHDSKIEGSFDKILIEVKEINSFVSTEQKKEAMINESLEFNYVSLHKNFESSYMTFTNCTNLIFHENDSSSLSISSKNQSIKNIADNDEQLSYYIELLIDLKFKEIEKNNRAIKESTNKSYLSQEYLNYSKYGICGSLSVFSKKPIITSIDNFYIANNNKNVNFLFRSRPQVQFYSPIIHIDPFTVDKIDLDVLSKNIELNSEKYIPNTIIITPSSFINLTFSNGIQSWGNDVKFNQKVIAFKLENDKINDFELPNIRSYMSFEFKGLLNLEISCHYKIDYDLKIIIETYNEKSSNLLNPKKTTYDFIVSCRNVNSYSLIVEDDYSQPEILKVPQKDMIEYTRQINSDFYVRVYAQDINSRFFVNHFGEKGAIKKNNFEVDQNDNKKLFYLRKKIILGDYIGKIPVTYISNLNTKQSLLINTVNKAFLEPSYVKIYLDSYFEKKFNILNGSGEFVVKVTNELGTLLYNSEKNRELYFKPSKLGKLEILLYDKNYSLTEHVSSSTVIIELISKIQFFSPQYLMVGSKISSRVKVYDSQGLQFSKDIIDTMNLQLAKQIESGYFTLLRNQPDVNRLILKENHIVEDFELEGIKIGVQSLCIVFFPNDNNYSESFSQYNNPNIKFSNLLTIHVFEKISVFPPSLLLYPGSEFTLKIIGGPENGKSLKYSFIIDNTDVASINSNLPLVKAHKIGQTEVKIKIKYNSEENQIYSTNEEETYYKSINNLVLCETLVPVRVEFPDRIEIEGANNRKLFNNSIIRLIASLKLGEVSFTYGVGNIEFEWSVDNPHVARFSNKSYFDSNTCSDEKFQEKKSITDSSHNVIAVGDNALKLSNNVRLELSHKSSEIGCFFFAFNYGLVSVKLITKINYPPPYENHRPNIFFTKKVISIEENVWVDIAEFYDKNPGKSSLYLLPHNITHDLKPHRKDQVSVFNY